MPPYLFLPPPYPSNLHPNPSSHSPALPVAIPLLCLTALSCPPATLPFLSLSYLFLQPPYPFLSPSNLFLKQPLPLLLIPLPFPSPSYSFLTQPRPFRHHLTPLCHSSTLFSTTLPFPFILLLPLPYHPTSYLFNLRCPHHFIATSICT
jgi:hypothetical protein